MQSRPLDYPSTEAEIRSAAKKLKNDKNIFGRKLITNEIIKASLPMMLPVCLKRYEYYSQFRDCTKYLVQRYLYNSNI